MNREFVPYELALKLKELGFDEECFGCYIYHGKRKGNILTWTIYESILNQGIKAPLWQQAFDFFRKKGFRFYIESHRYTPVEFFMANVYNGKRTTETFGKSLTYEEARLKCLEKLIEIVENGKHK